MTRSFYKGFVIAIIISIPVWIGIGFAVKAIAWHPINALCVPKNTWDANDRNRPCAQVSRIWEDGSLKVVVYEHDGDIRYRATVGAEDR